VAIVTLCAGVHVVVFAIGVLAGSLSAEAQPAERITRIGYLSATPAARSRPVQEAFLKGLSELGYIEGRSVVIESRYAEGKPDRFPALAAELVALKVDVIVTDGGTLAALAAKRATTTLPVVFTSVGDPVSDGLVNSLGRPGGNLTGLALDTTDLVGKWLELLRQAVPGVNRIAVLLKPDAVPDQAKRRFLNEAEIAAKALGVGLHIAEARSREDFDPAFSGMIRARAGGLVVLATAVFALERQRLVDLALKSRLPTVFSLRVFVDAGGLMSYGPDQADLARRAARYVDKILKGAKPADLPVEQPTKFELVINLKTAKVLGLTIPPSLLARADQVIE